MSHFVRWRLATLKFETELQKCNRIGLTKFGSFIWGEGGIASDIRLQI